MGFNHRHLPVHNSLKSFILKFSDWGSRFTIINMCIYILFIIFITILYYPQMSPTFVWHHFGSGKSATGKWSWSLVHDPNRSSSGGTRTRGKDVQLSTKDTTGTLSGWSPPSAAHCNGVSARDWRSGDSADCDAILLRCGNPFCWSNEYGSSFAA